MTDLRKYIDVQLDNDTIGQIQAKVLHIKQLYKTGKPLFPRQLLEDLNRQINEGKDDVQIRDFDDHPRNYSLKVPSWCADFA